MALVDELAHTTVPGSVHEKRWQVIEELLEAGIDVVSTVNVQHLESLNDGVEAISSVPQRETVPDSVVRAAEQVELALSNYFRPGNPTALRELALLWLADSVDEGLQRYRGATGASLNLIIALMIIGIAWLALDRILRESGRQADLPLSAQRRGGSAPDRWPNRPAYVGGDGPGEINSVSQIDELRPAEATNNDGGRRAQTEAADRG